jgi:hypothetical protein
MGRVRSVLLSLALAVLTVAVIAGCGKSQPTKAQYVARANKLCAAENKTLKAFAEMRKTPEELINGSFRIREHANAQLRAIRIPPKEKVPAEWLHLRESAIRAARKIFKTKPHTPQNKAANAAYNQLEGAAVKIALNYGLGECFGFAAT